MADDTITFPRINKEENNLQNKLELKKKTIFVKNLTVP